MDWVPVIRLADLRDGLSEVAAGGATILLARQGDELYASSALCPHKFTPLDGGALGRGCLTCPLHNATFDLATGKPYPGSEFAGRLAVYAVRVVDGVVEVEL